MRVHDLIHRRQQVYSVSDEMTVHEAAGYMRRNQLRACGVLDGGNNLVGVLSQSDISDKVAAENLLPAGVRVSDIMSRQLVIVSPELSMDECLRQMEKHGIFHLLVMDDAGGFHGM